MKTKTQAATKSRVCIKSVTEAFAGFSDRNLKMVTMTLLKMLCKRSADKQCDTISPERAELLCEVIRTVDPWAEYDGLTFQPGKAIVGEVVCRFGHNSKGWYVHDGNGTDSKYLHANGKWKGVPAYCPTKQDAVALVDQANWLARKAAERRVSKKRVRKAA